MLVIFSERPDEKLGEDLLLSLNELEYLADELLLEAAPNDKFAEIFWESPAELWLFDQLESCTDGLEIVKSSSDLNKSEPVISEPETDVAPEECSKFMGGIEFAEADKEMNPALEEQGDVMINPLDGS